MFITIYKLWIVYTLDKVLKKHEHIINNRLKVKYATFTGCNYELIINMLKWIVYEVLIITN